LLLHVCRSVLGVGGPCAAADDRTRGRPDAGAAAAADSTADRRSDAGAEESAAKRLRTRLGARLVAQRGNRRIGVLPAGLIIVIRLRRRTGACREHRQDRAKKTRSDRPHGKILLLRA
jgi:hypothetical protein